MFHQICVGMAEENPVLLALLMFHEKKDLNVC